jgi:hypothetical protein
MHILSIIINIKTNIEKFLQLLSTKEYTIISDVQMQINTAINK